MDVEKSRFDFAAKKYLNSEISVTTLNVDETFENRSVEAQHLCFDIVEKEPLTLGIYALIASLRRKPREEYDCKRNVI